MIRWISISKALWMLEKIKGKFKKGGRDRGF